jgi:protein transport protein SEC31
LGTSTNFSCSLTTGSIPVNTPSKLISKYGDGFVTSSSHPELAQQYGNVGTSNPYGAPRPGTAAAVLAQPQVTKPPVSGTLNLAAPPEVNPDHEPIKEALLEIVQGLGGMQLSLADKKQLSEGEKGVAVLLKRLSRGDIDSEVSTKVLALVEALRNGDYFAATSMQTSLVSTEWREHKDWLKGIKNLIQLVSKKSLGR